jgi:hypothetical protein
VGELRAELGRLRSDLHEQLSSEMLVERIVMRTQASRLTAGEGARLEASPSWQDEPPRELTGGWPAIRLEEHTGTQQYERVRVDRPAPPHPWQTAPRAPAAAPAYAPPPVPEAPRPPEPEPAWTPPSWTPPAWTPPAPPTEGYGMSLPPRRSRHAAAGEDPDAVPPPSPREWLESRSLLDDPPAGSGGDPTGTAEPTGPLPRRRRTDDGAPPAYAHPDEMLTTERPAAPSATSAGRYAAPPVPSATPARPGPGHARLEEILAEGGVDPAAGGRRRRRYRDEDDAQDDVLARVLRGE